MTKHVKDWQVQNTSEKSTGSENVFKIIRMF